MQLNLLVPLYGAQNCVQGTSPYIQVSTGIPFSGLLTLKSYKNLPSTPVMICCLFGRKNKTRREEKSFIKLYISMFLQNLAT
jgi:hypothetical protein